MSNDVSSSEEKPNCEETYMDWYQGELVPYSRCIYNGDHELIENDHVTKCGIWYIRQQLKRLNEQPIDFWRNQYADSIYAHLCIVPREENPTSMTVFSIRKITIQERQQKKVNRIMKWAEGREQFGLAFTWKMRDLLNKGTKLNQNQERALDNIIDKWNIRDVCVEKK